jgi:predicted permease
MSHDLKVALRTLIKRPAFAVSVIATLGLGIGASTMMFALLDAAILKPLPFRAPDGLVMLWGVAGPERDVRGGSFPEVMDWRNRNQTLEGVAIYDETSLNLTLGNSEPIRVETEMVSATYFPLLGIEASIGRTFLPEEDQSPGQRPVALVSHALWRSRFGSDPGVVGRTVQLNDRPSTIVGVMPAGFHGLSFDTDVWIPSMMVVLTSDPSVVTSRGNRWLFAVGRLKTSTSLVQAQQDLDRVAATLERDYPSTNRERGVNVVPLRDALLGSTRPLVIALFSAVVVFLVVAAANVASLQLARTHARRREFAVREALGARQWHLLRQLLVESLVLAVFAGIGGALVAAWSTTAVIALMPDGALPRYVTPAIDPRALLFTTLITVATGALVAILPVTISRARDLTATIKQGARSASGGLASLRRSSKQQALVVAEIALAMALLTSAGLMARSLERQLNVRVGVEPGGVTAAQLTLPGARYTPAVRAVFVERLDEQLRTIPTVTMAAIGSDLPFVGGSSASSMPSPLDSETTVRYFRHFITPDFFATLGIAMTRGRAFTAQDRQGAPPVAIVSESGARRLWGGADALGRRFRLGPNAPEIEVVGIAADARFRNLNVDLSAASAEPDLFFPFAQRTDRDLGLAVRSADGSTVSLRALQAAVSAVDGSIPVYGVQALSDAVAQQTATSRFGAVLLAAFSAGALLLAAIGLYGLVAYVVGLSAREIAIRLALGASASGVVRLIVRNGLVLVGAGLLFGTAGAIAAGWGLQTQLFEITAVDPATYAAVAFTLVVVALVASALPAHRAVRRDLQTVLRGD